MHYLLLLCVSDEEKRIRAKPLELRIAYCTGVQMEIIAGKETVFNVVIDLKRRGDQESTFFTSFTLATFLPSSSLTIFVYKRHKPYLYPW